MKDLQRGGQRYGGMPAKAALVIAGLLVAGACATGHAAPSSPTTRSGPQARATAGPSTILTTVPDSGSTVSTTTLPGTTFAPVPTSTTLTPGSTPLGEAMVPETDAVSVSFEQTTINGISYTNALLMSPGHSNGVVQIAAERQYNHFVGQLGIPDNQQAESAYTVSISLDGSAPLVSTEVHFGATTPINIPVAGALRIKISVTNIADCCGWVAIGDPTLS